MLQLSTPENLRPRGVARASLVWAAALIYTLMVAPSFAQQGPPPAQVRVAAAEQRMMSPQVMMPGTVVSRNDSNIASEIDGLITWVADEGAAVEEGDVIARIDQRVLRLQERNNMAEVSRLEAQLRYRENQLARIEELAATNNTPQSTLEQALSDRDMTVQELEQARIALERTRLDLARSEVRAPFPGRIVQRLTQIGEYAGSGAEIVRLVDTRHLEVRAQVPVAMATSIADGLSVQLRGADRVGTSPIRTVIPVGEEVSRMMEIRVALEDNGWIIGMPVQVGLPTSAARSVIAVPRDALILRPSATYIWTIAEDNTAQRVDVETGAASGSFIEVRGRIDAGDRVVVRGGERLRPGQSVQILNGSAG